MSRVAESHCLTSDTDQYEDSQEGDLVMEEVPVIPCKCNLTLLMSTLIDARVGTLPERANICVGCGDVGALAMCSVDGCHNGFCMRKSGGQIPCIVEEGDTPFDRQNFVCPPCARKSKMEVPVSNHIISIYSN